LKQDDDSQLFQCVKNNDKTAFDCLFRKYYSMLCHYAFKFIDSADVAEDLVQEVFVSIWTHRNTININKSIAHYLFTSVKYRAFAYIRSQGTRKEYEQEYSEKESFANEEEEFPLTGYEIACMVSDAVKQLPVKCRKAFLLSREEGLTYREIAEHMNISLKTVENQMSIAFKKIRIILEPILKKQGVGFMIILIYYLLFYN
jgi:RNA polymerase sigma-70 factor, ECF subfamily